MPAISQVAGSNLDCHDVLIAKPLATKEPEKHAQTSGDCVHVRKDNQRRAKAFCTSSLQRYTDFKGATECLLCPNGTYVDAVGQTGCTPCEPGLFPQLSLQCCMQQSAS
eukprot:3940886-Amphidinium_carterae.1